MGSLPQPLQEVLFLIAFGQDFGARLRYLPAGFVLAIGQGRMFEQSFQRVLIPEPGV